MTREISQTVTDGESNDQAIDGATGGEPGETDAGSQRAAASVTEETRAEVLKRDRYHCQVCGRDGPQRGGLATLEIHHIEDDPDGIDRNDSENLTTLCRACHNWVHQQATRDDAPVELTEADLSVLLPQDIEILRYLANEGPARTGEVADALTADLSVTTVRERLAVLMGLDHQVDSRDRQIVDQDADTGEWGLTEQIENSARGHIPTEPQALIQRVEDEQVRQALNRGCDRETVMDVLDVSRRTTFHKEKRARAYDFPLDAFRRGGNGGQHPAGSAASEATVDPDTDSNETAEQQRLATVPEDLDDDREAAARESVGSAQDEQGESVENADPYAKREVVREELQAVIAELQKVSTELSQTE